VGISSWFNQWSTLIGMFLGSASGCFSVPA
jgi:hypothetical protein